MPRIHNTSVDSAREAIIAPQQATTKRRAKQRYVWTNPSFISCAGIPSTVHGYHNPTPLSRLSRRTQSPDILAALLGHTARPASDASELKRISSCKPGVSKHSEVSCSQIHIDATDTTSIRIRKERTTSHDPDPYVALHGHCDMDHL